MISATQKSNTLPHHSTESFPDQKTNVLASHFHIYQKESLLNYN
jgi:hypothetical protein